MGRRGACEAKKKSWGALKEQWVPHDLRDTVVDFVREWSTRTELPSGRFIEWIGVQRGKYYDWVGRYGKANEHNALVPRDHWILPDEREAILAFHAKNPLEGYRRLTFMMLDQQVAAVAPTTTWRVLSSAGVIDKWKKKASKKGTGFVQPLKPHEHWHVDIAHLNIAGTFYYMCSVLDGCSRAVVAWDIRASMVEQEVEVTVQKAREAFPGHSPRIISDNGPQFIAGDFKDFVRISGMTHVRTSPYHPQANGKVERYQKTAKVDCIRPKAPASLEEARRVVKAFVAHYNGVRLHSAIGYVTPNDLLAGRKAAIHAERDRRLEAARDLRAFRRAAARSPTSTTKVQAS